MSAEIVYSTDALIDLDEAWDFTVETSGDPDLWPALNKVSFWGCVVGWFWGYRYRMCVWLLM